MKLYGGDSWTKSSTHCLCYSCPIRTIWVNQLILSLKLYVFDFFALLLGVYQEHQKILVRLAHPRVYDTILFAPIKILQGSHRLTFGEELEYRV
jgi:hypothetical protein